MNLHVLREIAIQTNLDDLPNLCQTDKNFEKICSDHVFWKNKYSQMGVIMIKPQLSIQGYIDDLKHGLMVVRLIDSILSRLKFSTTTGEKSYLTVKVTDLKQVSVPGIDLKIVKKMLNYNKQRWLRFGTNPEMLKEIRTIEGMDSWGSKATLYYDSRSQQYQFLFYVIVENEVDSKIMYQLFNVTGSVQMCIYLLIYYGLKLDFSRESPFQDHLEKVRFE